MSLPLYHSLIIHGKRVSTPLSLKMEPSNETKPACHFIRGKENLPAIQKQMEHWKSVVGYEGLYEVSNHGSVRSLKCGRIREMSKARNPKNYEFVCLMKEGTKNTCRVHRMVGEAFLPPVEGKETIDHIDRNPQNNHVSNLRWADSTEQNINRNTQSNTNHKNISQSVITGNYHVVIRRYGNMLMNAAFHSLDEAIAARDEYLSSLEFL